MAKLVPVLCNEKRLDGTTCNGMYRRSLEGAFYCDKCGIQHESAFGSEVMDYDSLDSYYEYLRQEARILGDNIDDNDVIELPSLASKYQGEQETGGKNDPAITAIEKRLEKNLMNWKKGVHLVSNATPTADETASKEKLHEKVITTRKVKKDIQQKQRTDSVYKSNQTEKRQGARIAAVLFWTKQGPIKSNELRHRLEESGLKVGRQSFQNLLDDLTTQGRISMTKPVGKDGEDMSRVPYLVTYLK